MIRRIFAFMMALLLGFALVNGVGMIAILPEREPVRVRGESKKFKYFSKKTLKRMKKYYSKFGEVIVTKRGLSIIQKKSYYTALLMRFPFVQRYFPTMGPNKWWKVRRVVRRWWYKNRLNVAYATLAVVLLMVYIGVLPEMFALVFGASYYLDVSAGSNGDGSENSPFNIWSSFYSAMTNATGAPHTGYIKRGTEITGNNSLYTAYAGGTLTAYGTGAPPVVHFGMEISYDNWTIHDIDIDGTGVTTGSYLVYNNGVVNNLTLYNVDASNKAFMAFNGGGGGFSIHDFTVNASTSAMNFEATPTNKFGNTEIYNFKINCNTGGSSDGLSIHTSQDEETGGTGWDVHDGEIYNCAENALDLTACGGGQFYKLDLHDTTGGIVYPSYRTTNVHLHHSLLYNSNNCAIMDGSVGPNYYYKNWIHIGASAVNGAIYVNDYYHEGVGTDKVDFYFEGNTLIVDGNLAFKVSEQNGGVIQNCHINNNIVTTSGSTLSTVYSFAGFTWSELTSENNIYYNPAGDPQMTSSVSWTTWIGTHTEAGKNDPLLVDRTLSTYGDYRDCKLASTSSPAYGNATYSTTGTYYKRDGTSVIGLSNVDDYDGDAGAGDIGFDEYIASGNPPTMSVQAESDVQYTSITANGTIVSIGDSTPTVRGFKYNTSESHTGESDVSETGSFSTGAYSLTISGLSPNTTYYYCSYATNDQGTAYSPTWESFTTSDYLAGATLTMQAGDDIVMSNGDDMSDTTLNVGVTNTLTTNSDTDSVTLGVGSNLGSMGTESHTGTVSGGTWTECGEYLGGFSVLEPGSCGGEPGGEYRHSGEDKALFIDDDSYIDDTLD